MVFEPIDFAQFNETDVREEILAPLLRQLGYQTGTRNNIIREQSLRYPRAYIGRKNSQRDPELRGKADYICEVDRKIRWTIEAKSPASKSSTRGRWFKYNLILKKGGSRIGAYAETSET